MVKNIIFSGGGFKCWAYIGTLRVLKEYHFDVEQIIGVSAGSLFGLCYILGMTWEFLLDYFMNINFKELIDINLDNFLTQQSFMEGIKFTNSVRELISYVIDPDITFKGLYQFSKIKFTVNALNITDSKLEYFNYQLTPDIKVVDAVRASCNLPIFFPPYQINDKFYYDGGLCNNCPIDIVEEVDTIAFNLSDHGISNSSMKLMDLLFCLVNMSNNFYYNNSSSNIYHILDTKFNDQMFNLNQSRDDIFNIYMDGYINSKNIIFKNHIALPWNQDL